MATSNVLGASPVSYTSEDAATAGSQVQAPLSVLKLTDGAVDFSGWADAPASGSNDEAVLKALLANLVAAGALWAPPP